MKFTPVKKAQKGTPMARALTETPALMISTASESVSQLNHVWDLLGMTASDKTKEAIIGDLEIENILEF